MEEATNDVTVLTDMLPAEAFVTRRGSLESSDRPFYKSMSGSRVTFEQHRPSINNSKEAHGNLFAC